ncbi:hypothetical protein GF356_01810 [candidate division GN15 bacterium]|nr:hypothetical protein [candidate division GN15 bacterium]
MIWVKRIGAIVLIVAMGLVWWHYDEQQQQQEQELAKKYALATAKVMITRTQFRGKPGSFRSSRETVLSEQGVTPEDVIAYLERYEDKPEKYLEYSRLVKHYVDSLLTRRGY